jgi:hypothetical protein
MKLHHKRERRERERARRERERERGERRGEKERERGERERERERERDIPLPRPAIKHAPTAVISACAERSIWISIISAQNCTTKSLRVTPPSARMHKIGVCASLRIVSTISLHLFYKKD